MNKSVQFLAAYTSSSKSIKGKKERLSKMAWLCPWRARVAS